MTQTSSEDARYAREAEYTPSGRKPFRLPKPDALSLVLFAGWVAGVLVSTVVPFLIVPPTSPDPAPSQVGYAFLATMVGVAIFVGSGLLLWRHLKSSAVLVFALVPAVSIVSGGVILTATLLAI
ncbi:hypothetical protein [Aquipuribacter nitratireducens]|uniref:Uncharacterized protein n=1 Tax=Aquipuribacter nitratireducens TaxID=650104 RepID=A0ABW0GWJ6_9MICO